MPEAMAVLWEVVKDNSLNTGEKLELIFDFDKVFGLSLEIAQEVPVEEIPEEIKILAQSRADAKAAKDFKKADEIRDLLKQKGFEIADSKDGFEIKKI